MTPATVVALVLVGSLATAWITWSFLLFSGALISGDRIARRCLRMLEIWMVVALGGFYVLRAKSPTERKLVLLVIGLMIATWLIQHARRLQARRRSQ